MYEQRSYLNKAVFSSLLVMSLRDVYFLIHHYQILFDDFANIFSLLNSNGYSKFVRKTLDCLLSYVNFQLSILLLLLIITCHLQFSNL